MVQKSCSYNLLKNVGEEWQIQHREWQIQHRSKILEPFVVKAGFLKQGEDFSRFKV